MAIKKMKFCILGFLKSIVSIIVGCNQQWVEIVSLITRRNEMEEDKNIFVINYIFPFTPKSILSIFFSPEVAGPCASQRV